MGSNLSTYFDFIFNIFNIQYFFFIIFDKTKK
jgi:hypothetical protein